MWKGKGIRVVKLKSKYKEESDHMISRHLNSYIHWFGSTTGIGGIVLEEG